MTAVAVEYRPAMDSCMVGKWLNRPGAPTAPTARPHKRSRKVPGRPAQGYLNVKRLPKVSQVRSKYERVL